MAVKVTLSSIKLQPGTTNTYYVTWTFKKHSDTDHYQVMWEYSPMRTKSGRKWFHGNGAEGEEVKASAKSLKQSTYTPDGSATVIRVAVKPISKSEKKSGKTTYKYTGAAWTKFKTFTISGDYIDPPDSPTVTVDKGSLKAVVSYSNQEREVTGIRFEVVEDNRRLYSSGNVTLAYESAAYKCGVNPGHTYKVRAAAYISKATKNNTSDFSSYSSATASAPGNITSTPVVKSTGESQVLIAWGAAVNADHYEIEYTQKKEYFGSSSSEVQSESTVGAVTSWYISNIEQGKTWYFRVRAVGSGGDSNGAWSTIVQCAIGTKPNPPTTWTYLYSAVVGDTVTLYWTHNTADGSTQSAAKVGLRVNNGAWTDHTVTGETSSYDIDTTNYQDGDVIEWRVSTKGAIDTYSDASVIRKLTLHVQPTVAVNVDSEITSFPVTIEVISGPNTQQLTSAVISIKALEAYETRDEIGIIRNVSAGEEIYSEVFNTFDSDTFSHDLVPGAIDLENNISYSVDVTIAMDSGLTADTTTSFTVSFDEEEFSPDAEITFDEDTLTCYIRPYCEVVSQDDEDEDEPIEPETNVYLSVYRREYDGSFVAIGTGLDGEESTAVTDPHPALDLARYRIVAISKTTGQIAFTDVPGVQTGIGSIVIQWDEEWSEFNYSVNDIPTEPPWSGSMLKLPYNVDVTSDHAPDVELVEYIGRSNPVSYYGTQKGESGRWSVEIPKSDSETIYQVRRLATYKGDCYIREPSGMGYWANVGVSYSMTHNKLTVPVNFSIKRVEGGM